MVNITGIVIFQIITLTVYICANQLGLLAIVPEMVLPQIKSVTSYQTNTLHGVVGNALASLGTNVVTEQILLLTLVV